MSLVVITLNEEANLERCLQSVPFAEEIVVLDSFSTDQTASIAKKYSARFEQRSFQGFGEQKRAAVALAHFDWVLCLDADEALSLELQNEILKNFSDLQPEEAVAFPRRSFHLGRWITHGGWYPDCRVRLFHRQFFNWSLDKIHETVVAQTVKRFKGDLLHFVFRDLHHQVTTNNRYSSLQAQNLFEQGKRFSIFKLVTKPWVKFIELYFFKRGFQDGLPGFVIALGGAYSTSLKWAKLWELEQKAKESSS